MASKKKQKKRVRDFKRFSTRLEAIALKGEIERRALEHHVSLRELYEGPIGAPSITAARRAVYLWLMEEGKGLNEIARLFDRAVSGISKMTKGGA